MRTIVVGYDGSEFAERALDRAAGIAEAFAARLVIAAVAELPLTPAPELMPDQTLPGPAPAGPILVPPPPHRAAPGAPQDVEEPALELLDRARHQLSARTIETAYVATAGDPAESLLEVSGDYDADLIVIGSHAHGFLDRLLGGATDERVVRKAQRDVLLVH
jgi:nucleotide-binding universal stress UspA family protein